MTFFEQENLILIRCIKQCGKNLNSNFEYSKQDTFKGIKYPSF